MRDDREEGAGSEAEIEALVRRFEDGSLPRSEWHHRQHLSVALWYLTRYPPEEATERIREGIKRFNAAKGVPQTRDGGYHETLTLHFIHRIRLFLAGADRSLPLPVLAALVVERLGDMRCVLEHYSRDRILSWEARTSYVEPDLKPLDA